MLSALTYHFSIVLLLIYLMRCAIWYHLCNLKNVKNTHGGVLILVKLQASAVRRFMHKASGFSCLGGSYISLTAYTTNSISQSKIFELTTLIFLSCSSFFLNLTQFRAMFPFYTRYEHQKTFGFLVLSGSIK